MTKDAHSETVRKAAINWFSGTTLSRLNNPETRKIIVIAHLLRMEDLPGHLMASDGCMSSASP